MAPTVTALFVAGPTLSVGSSAQFTATATFSNSTIQSVTTQASWQSSNAAVASVTGAGLVAGVSAGTADITATYQNVSGTAHVTVNREPPPAYTISGMVTDAQSHGVLPDVRIASFDGAANQKLTTTDSSGNYSIAGVVGGIVVVTAVATNYATSTQALTVAGDTRLDFVLQRMSSSLERARR